jgi:hypothetical protein
VLSLCVADRAYDAEAHDDCVFVRPPHAVADVVGVALWWEVRFARPEHGEGHEGIDEDEGEGKVHTHKVLVPRACSARAHTHSAAPSVCTEHLDAVDGRVCTV